METVRNPWLRVLCLVASVSLVACGGSDTKVESVTLQVLAGSQSAVSVDGPRGTHLVVPAGATSSDVVITLSTMPPSRPPPGNALVVGEAMRLEPEGMTFSKAVELTIPIASTSLPPGTALTDVVDMRA